jgi:hypothetical protein
MTPRLSYHLYCKPESSIFDLIEGSGEVQQTKGLALLLAKDPEFLHAFLKLPQIRDGAGKIHIDDYDRILVHSEMITVNEDRAEGRRKRIDICICFYRGGTPDICLVIEAKSAGTQASSAVFKQLREYLSSATLAAFDASRRFGIVLTKNRVVSCQDHYQTLLWDDVVQLLAKLKPGRGSLAHDYFHFLTHIHGAMKFYEKEVCSIPAKASSWLLDKEPFIYECPNKPKDKNGDNEEDNGENEGKRKRNGYPRMKTPLYLAFRKEGGVMERLYGLDEIIILNPGQDLDTFLKSTQYSEDVKARIQLYCEKVWKGSPANEEKRFHVLSRTNQIALPHLPRPHANNAYRAYYRLADLLDKNKKIVEKEK